MLYTIPPLFAALNMFVYLVYESNKKYSFILNSDKYDKVWFLTMWVCVGHCFSILLR